MTKQRILIVDDEDYMRKLIKKSLVNENYYIEEASNGLESLKLIKNNLFDLIILDVMLKDEDGFELIKEIKAIGFRGPIIFVSGRSEDYDKILGLGLGASNYITKPFIPAILCAHVKAQLRSYKEYSLEQRSLPKFILNGPFKFDFKTYRLYKNDILIDLSYKENLLMKFFMENPEQVFTKEQLYENMWSDTIIDDNSIMVYMHQLRKKIEENPKSPKHIITVWGIGYKFMP
ncbi:response regulator transcription factor [Alkaliphilus transvaalensis]|uniref:response regulator transcription factor n=1 Tax=Alkaliphilus transvaalensis TaxID=114628 RepID=UPI0004794760|nr:response regulator transcription factor [Alkaliphilus transvaalensis]